MKKVGYYQKDEVDRSIFVTEPIPGVTFRWNNGNADMAIPTCASMPVIDESRYADYKAYWSGVGYNEAILTRHKDQLEAVKKIGFFCDGQKTFLHWAIGGPSSDIAFQIFRVRWGWFYDMWKDFYNNPQLTAEKALAWVQSRGGGYDWLMNPSTNPDPTQYVKVAIQGPTHTQVRQCWVPISDAPGGLTDIQLLAGNTAMGIQGVYFGANATEQAKYALYMTEHLKAVQDIVGYPVTLMFNPSVNTHATARSALISDRYVGRDLMAISNLLGQAPATLDLADDGLTWGLIGSQYSVYGAALINEVLLEVEGATYDPSTLSYSLTYANLQTSFRLGDLLYNRGPNSDPGVNELAEKYPSAIVKMLESAAGSIHSGEILKATNLYRDAVDAGVDLLNEKFINTADVQWTFQQLDNRAKKKCSNKRIAWLDLQTVFKEASSKMTALLTYSWTLSAGGILVGTPLGGGEQVSYDIHTDEGRDVFEYILFRKAVLSLPSVSIMDELCYAIYKKPFAEVSAEFNHSEVYDDSAYIMDLAKLTPSGYLLQQSQDARLRSLLALQPYINDGFLEPALYSLYTVFAGATLQGGSNGGL